MLPLIFEKHKICSNRTISLLIVKDFEDCEDFAMERHFLRNSTFLSTMLQASIRLLENCLKVIYRYLLNTLVFTCDLYSNVIE